MKRINAIRVVCFSIAAVLIAVGFLIKTQLSMRDYRLQIENNYSRSLDELNASVNNISLFLEKAEYSTTPKQMSQMAANLLSESETAKTSLSQLPLGDGELSTLNRFLSQVGNYAMTISKSLIGGDSINDDFITNISMLSETSKKISEVINDSQISYNNKEYWAKELQNRIDGVVDTDSLQNTFGELEDNLTDYPTLIYDGPYSDHILKKEPEMIKNASKVSEVDAIKKAALLAGCEESSLTSDGLDNGKIPAYRFSNNNLSISISRSGGYGVYMRKIRKVGDNILTTDQALEKAKRYLEKIGLTGFSETYYYNDEGVCVYNFAYVDGITICYTDLIKIGVAMDTGEIMLLETSGYLTNHCERAFETPAISEKEASEHVSKKLTIKEKAMALIPTDSGGNVRCYEFVCTSEADQDVLVYINSSTGEEESILILLKTDGGTLAK